MTIFIVTAELIQISLIVCGLLYLPENFNRATEDFDPVNGLHTIDKDLVRNNGNEDRIVPEVDVQHKMSLFREREITRKA